jgi:hypothetical protein
LTTTTERLSPSKTTFTEVFETPYETWQTTNRGSVFAAGVELPHQVIVLDSPADTSAYQSEVEATLEHSWAATLLEEEERELQHFRYFVFNMGSSATVLVDEQTPENSSQDEIELEYQKVIAKLRNGGREILAEELIDILRNCQNDLEEPEIKLFSLQSMARFLVLHRDFEDPIIGPDPTGLMQVEWHIDGEGLLVMAFLEHDMIHCIAQANETPNRQALNSSVFLTEEQALKDFGYLVPKL